MVHTLLWELYKGIHSTLFPTFCSSCRLYLKEGEVLCKKCTDRIKPIAPKDIALTATKNLTVFAASWYEAPLKDLITAKSRSDTWAAHCLAHLIYTHTIISYSDVDYFIPIPLHWTRYAQRGYNQATIIARQLAKLHGAECIEPLQRTQRTAFQYSLPKEQKVRNVADAFGLTTNATLLEKLKGKHLVLVDDLMTTGSTLKYAAKELLGVKPLSLKAVVACRI